MKNHLQKLSLMAAMLCISAYGFGQSQTYLSESWTGQGGEMAVFYHNATVTDSQKNVYVTGSTLNLDNNNDIIIQKFNSHGALLWDITFNGAADMDDMAADIFVDNAFNVYVTGASIDNVSADFDLIVLKYNSSGQHQWTKYYDNNGQPTPKDGGTSITGDNAGRIFVTGGSFGSNTLSDYVTLCLNESTGAILWTNRYDHVQYNELASKILVNGNQVVVSGGSQATLVPNRWAIATLTYNKSTGALISTNRSSGNATTGTDEIYDVTTDSNGNYYLTGSVVNTTTGKDIAVYKLDDNLDIIWQQTYDGHGNDDKGFGIKLDSQDNVYIAGYTETNDQGDNYSILKYNSSGALQWDREFNGESNLDDRAAQLVIDADDRIFVTGEARNEGYSDFQTVAYRTDGEIITQTAFDGPDGLDDKPTHITLDTDGNLIVIGQSEISTGWKNYTVKYAIFERSLTPVMAGGEPSHVEGELLIRFDRSVVNYSAIDNKRFEAGKLNEFISQSTITQMSQKVGFDCSNLETYKIFRGMTTADSVSTTRLGDVIKVDDFWATLSVYFPKEHDQQLLIDSLSTMSNSIHFAELDHILTGNSQPNDPKYSTQQTGLYNQTHGIKTEEAWDTQVGQDYTKIGVFDSGINWRHEDFGDGTWFGSKVKGWNFITNVSPATELMADVIGHGSGVAGIIGALRNNGKGVSGITGGDMDSLNTGCKLITMTLGHEGLVNGAVKPLFYVSQTAPATVIGAMENLNTGLGYGMHIQNHSYGGPQPSLLQRMAIQLCNRNGCLFVAGSGNQGEDILLQGLPEFPASYNKDWVTKVGASNDLGSRSSYSTFGYNLDFIAPGDSSLFASVDNNSLNGYSFNDSGTSYAAPHVTGVAGLMYSEHNPLNSGLYPNVLSPRYGDNNAKNCYRCASSRI